MLNKKNWFSMPKRELFLLLFLIIYPIVFFLPWTYNIMILNVTLLAWGAYALYFLAPIVSIIVLSSEQRTIETDKKTNVSI
ncbi:hypothetical protein IT084_07125 [Desulfallas sp. Bu1-1]|uniref:hypothetical protein n=1 Tax=Desulfallas sp. Bu1-1 TaxID=2787620 RepID=UPI00189CC410|nr:hypothetical protein [Desulfallas sp. Bu1-1]MBF7082750.1 hypothetical protein [Desulfallas sp. Bu1-1]